MNEKQTGVKGSSSVLGVVLVALGILFLADQILDFNIGQYFWPMWVILPGLAFFVGMVMGGKNAAPLAIPGSIIVMTGLLMFVQNLFNIWETWAYAWALVGPTAVGIGLTIAGKYGDNEEMVESGRTLVRIGLGLFVGFFIFFEVLIGIGGIIKGSWNQWLLPAALIGLGLYFMVGRRSGGKDSGESEAR